MLVPRDNVDMEKRFPNWKYHRLLPYFWAISIFLCSRAVVALGLVFSQKYLPVATDVWSAGPHWYHQLLQWDSEWYFKIATEGYRYNGDPTIQQNVVFYPLYPMLARSLAAIRRPAACGCIASGIERRGIVGDHRSLQAGSRGIW